ncbi:MAG: efflux RND transporter permease subunit [Sandaracinaceae bacterium]
MSITERAIRNSRVTLIALLVLLFAGMSSYYSMPRAMDPGFTIRVAQVATLFPGASPERVEQLVTDKIEEVVQEIPELDYVTSSSETGVSVVNVVVREEFTEMRPIWDDLRRKVEDLEPDLPEGIIGPQVDDDFGDVYGVLLTIVAEGYTYPELRDIGDDVRDELLRIEDVAKVEVIGNQEERVFVEYETTRLSQAGLSPRQLEGILADQNIINPGGDIRIGEERIVLEPTGNFESVDAIERMLIPLPDGTVTVLGDLTNVRRALIDPPEERVRADGERALCLAISMRDGGNLIRLGENVQTFVDRLPGLYPIGVEAELAFFEPLAVDTKVNDFVVNVLQAVGIVLAVMLLTLGLRTGTIVASLIPTTMIISLFLMSVFDIGLDQVSLASLIIALGLLVDNAIVMAEATMVKMQEGERPVDAAVGAARELQLPLLIASLTTSAAFLPIFLAESAVGEYTASIFKVVTIALLVSWMLALTMTPTLCALFLRVGPRDETRDAFDNVFYRTYRAFLITGLRFRFLSLGVVAVVFLGAMSLFAFVPALFFPESDRPIFTAALELPAGAPFEETEAMVDRVEGFFRDELLARGEREEGVAGWTSFIGATPPRFVLGFDPSVPRPNTATVLVNVTSDEVNDDMQDRLERFLLREVPDIKYEIRRLSSGPPVDRPVQVRVSGRDTARLFELVDQVKARMRQTGGITNVDDDWGTRAKKIIIDVDEARARRVQLTNKDVATALETNLTGLEATPYREGDQVIPVTLRSSARERDNLSRLTSLNIFSSASGRSVPLGQVADVELVWEPASIYRRDRLRTVTIGADVLEGYEPIALARGLGDWLEGEQESWGLGYRFELGGEIESSGTANESINAKLPIAGLVIVLLLVAQFNSLRKPVIVLATIPLALIGVVIGLLVMRSYFGFMTLLGVISLAGIVVNNAIVLLDRIKVEREELGRTAPQAVVEAGQRRLRPIVLTTVTSVASLLPLYFGGGIIFQPMAVAIGFGLIFSTVLTLGVIPIIYSLLFRVGFRDFAYVRLADQGSRPHGEPAGEP